MSQYNKLSDIQYARFQILHVDLNFGLFWSAGIPTMNGPITFDFFNSLFVFILVRRHLCGSPTYMNVYNWAIPVHAIGLLNQVLSITYPVYCVTGEATYSISVVS